jgi:hypothetical protein
MSVARPLLLAAALTLAARATAQTPVTNEGAAHTGIVLTPIGALPQVVRIDDGEDSTFRVEAQLRFSRWKLTDEVATFSNTGASVMLGPSKRFAFGGTVGYRSCPDCETIRFGSFDTDIGVWHQNSVHRGEGYIDIGLQTSVGLGYADSTDLHAFSAGLWLPVSVSIPQSNFGLISVTFSPGVAYGQITDVNSSVIKYARTDGGTRTLLGGSFSYVFPSGLGLHASVHRIAVTGSPTHMGVAATYRFGVPRRRRF